MLLKDAEEMALEMVEEMPPSATDDPVGKKRASVDSSGSEQEIAPGDEEVGEPPLKKFRTSAEPPLPVGDDEEAPPPEPTGHHALDHTSPSINPKGERPHPLRLSVGNELPQHCPLHRDRDSGGGVPSSRGHAAAGQRHGRGRGWRRPPQGARPNNAADRNAGR